MEGLDLRAMRKRLALRQKDLACMAGVSLTMWRMAERGDRQLSVKTVRCLMRELAYRYGTQTERNVLKESQTIVNDYWSKLSSGQWPAPLDGSPH